MQVLELEIKNAVGLHARPAAVFVQTANKFKSRMHLTKDGVRVSAKSIIGVLSLGAGHGARVLLEVSGEDEEEAAAVLSHLFESGFDAV